MTKLWASVQRLAITSQIETITRELVMEVMKTEFRTVILGIETVLNEHRIPAEVYAPDLVIPEQHVMDRCISETLLPVEVERVLSGEGPDGSPRKTRRPAKAKPVPAAATLDPKVLASADLRATAKAQGTSVTERASK